jgi:hypothetical protein
VIKYLNPARALEDLRHFVARLLADTPKYWRVVQLRAAVLLTAIEALAHSEHCPAAILPHANTAAAVLTVVIFFAQATKCDAPAPTPAPQDSNDVTT